MNEKKVKKRKNKTTELKTRKTDNQTKKVRLRRKHAHGGACGRVTFEQGKGALFHR